MMAGWIYLGCAGIYADDTPIRTLDDGIELTIGGEQVELRVATGHAFRLHVFLASDVAPSSSLYLQDGPKAKPEPATPYKVIHEGAAVGIKTAFGQLLVNEGDETWSLHDGAGKTLTDWAPLAKAGVGATDLHFRAGASPSVDSPLFYGSGNVPNRGALTQTQVTAGAGNGTAGLPQYWSTSGYGALLVGQDDKKPGSWKSGAHGSIDWTVPGTSADLYLMPASNLHDWVRDDAELTGFAPVPPRWAFGFMQSRWGWKDKAYIDDAFARFRGDKLPVDVFIFDFEWYTVRPDYTVPSQGDPNFIDFGWNPALFPDPVKQIADFARQGLHVVGIRKPRLGNTDNLVLARSTGWTLSSSRDLDFSQPEVRSWWAENNRKFLEAGIAAFWNDEGEVNYTEFAYWNLAEVDLLKQVRPEARFWSINRSFSPGMQRTGAAVWTGDIPSNWTTLGQTPGELLSYGLSGMPYSACDIGGFSGTPTPEILARWVEAGVFFPVMRSHSELMAQPHFPWLYGPEAEAAIRKALDLRYRLIPYYYSLAHDAYATAAPLMRPLVMEFPDDEKAAPLADEWLMGKGLLAAPILNQDGARSVYLPNDQWFDFGTTRITQGPKTVSVTARLDEVPVYVRAGTLLPLGPVLQYTDQASDAPLELQIYPGHDATFNFVEDDGKTLAYQSGNTRTTTFSWNEQTRTLSWKITGDYHGANLSHSLKAVLFSPQGRMEKLAALAQDGSFSFK